MPTPRQILVRGPNWTGDLVMATPGFRALRAAFPEARLVLHAREALLPLVAGAPWFDATIALRAEGSEWGGLLREARRLRAEGGPGFDRGLCVPDSFSSALLMRLGGVRGVVGYRRNARGALLAQAVPRPAFGPVPRERHVLGLVEALGAPERGTQLELFTTAAEEAAASRALEAHGLRTAAPLVLLAPGASYGPSKLWPAERFAAVGDALAGEGAAVAVIGTPAERSLAARVLAAMRAPAVDLSGAVGLGALKAVVRRSQLLLGNDAGARHLAVAFGVPCVVLMGPTALEKTAMNLERVTVLTADVACRPCGLRDCPIDHRCMTRIGPEAVARAARAALAGEGAAGAGEEARAPSAPSASGVPNAPSARLESAA